MGLIDILVWGVIGVFIWILGIIVGRYLDPFYKGYLLNALLKRQYAIITMVSKDGKELSSYVVSLIKGVINHKGRIYLIDKNRFARENKQEEGFTVTDKTPKYFRQGMVQIFVSEESGLPINFIKPDHEMSPLLIGTTINGYIENEIQLGVKKFWGTMQALLLILIFVSIANLLLTWSQGGAIGEINGNVKTLINVTSSNPSVVVGNSQTGTVRNVQGGSVQVGG